MVGVKAGLGGNLADTHPFRAGVSIAAERLPRRPLMQWRQAGVLALLCSGVAAAAMPRASEAASDERLQWNALAIAPLSSGGRTGMQMIATQDVQPIDFAPAKPTVERAMVFGRGPAAPACLTPTWRPRPQ
jgi:hypothetical protein